MKLFIMRHGEAGPRITSDDERLLTDQGRLDSHDMAEKYLSDTSFDYIFVSPYIRTQQTADEIVQCLNVDSNSIETWDAIVPGGNVAIVADKLSQIENADNILLVSHQPFVSDFLDYLIGGVNYLPMDTSSIACLKGDVVWQASMSLDFLKHKTH